MSHTYAYALTIAILLAVMLSPVLSSFLLRKGMKETHNFIWEAFPSFYHNLFVRSSAMAAAYACGDHADHGGGLVTSSRASAASFCRNWRRATSGRTRSCRRP